MALSFADWIVEQQERQDAIGALARVPSMSDSEPKASRRRFDEHRSWAEVVVRIAGPSHVAGFNEAWQEFLLAREALEDDSE